MPALETTLRAALEQLAPSLPGWSDEVADSLALQLALSVDLTDRVDEAKRYYARMRPRADERSALASEV